MYVRWAQKIIVGDPDHFGKIQILEKAMTVCGAIFPSSGKIRIRVVAKSTDLRSPVFHL
jgi:hypothetical protein